MAVGLVNPKQGLPGTSSNPSSLSQVPSIDQLVETYVGLVNSAPVRDRLASAGIPRTADALKAELTAVRRPDTTLIDIAVTDVDPAVALRIARETVPAFNYSLNDLQSKVIGGSSTQLDALVAWEIPTDVPTVPVSPDVPKTVFLGFLAGAALAVAIAFLIDHLDDSVKGEVDAGDRLGVPVLGSIGFRPGQDGRSGDKATLSALYTRDHVSEQYRSLRTNILYRGLEQRAQVIEVTSTVPGEGKTTTASNLAVVMAQAGNKVILVDADFRRPTLHEVFERPENIGLGNLLLRDREEKDLILATSIPGLSLICSGPTPPNPSELLGSANMVELLERLRKRADVIVIDSPPVGVVTDAAVLGARADGVVLVVEEARTSSRDIVRAMRSLTAVDARVLGIVLNKVRSRKADYYTYGEPDPAMRPENAEAAVSRMVAVPVLPEKAEVAAPRKPPTPRPSGVKS
ncbi:MAG: polysaccharide biosynthesis tyrosine autokinase [Candidatus Dormibacteria bacterium]